jgi:uncharacterized protein (DUF2062 family)
LQTLENPITDDYWEPFIQGFLAGACVTANIIAIVLVIFTW